MTQTTTTREAMLNATRGLKSVRLSEIVLRTSNYQELKDWYQAFLGVDPYLDNERACFRRLHDDYPYQQLFVIFNKDVKDQTEPVAGLDHIQFRHASLGDLVERYERLRDVGITPFRSVNRGRSTSFYYHDADGNTAELSAANFDTEQEFLAYMEANTAPSFGSGALVDPDEFAKRVRSGVPRAEL
jgi:catechol-2,3-dioxygenase